MTTFVDEAKIDVAAGDGGNGCMAFRREKFEPRGGPSGGDGGHGGSVVLVADRNLNTLFHLRHQPRLKAERGRHGEGSNKTGRSGRDLDVKVPLGTVVHDAETDDWLGEVLTTDDRLVVAQGGRGGRGNARFASATQRAPRRFEEGREGEQRRLRLELKLLADVGLVGLPNAGKSTLISALSAARPKVADYPFTTLVPQLGVVAGSVLDAPFVIADLPGLIEGAASGAGLGHQFLRHVERCRVLVHLVDLSGGTAILDGTGEESVTGQSAVEELEAIEAELRAFDPVLLTRHRLIVGSKLDAALDDRRTAMATAAAERGLDYFEISSATRAGLDPLTAAIDRLLSAAKAAEAAADGRDEAEEEVWRP